MTRALTSPTRKQKLLPLIGPSTTAEQQYRRALQTAVKAMAKSVDYWLLGKYRIALESNQAAETIANPERAADAKNPAFERRRLFLQLTDLRKQWEGHFAKIARKLATEVVNAAYQANKAAWQGRVKREGFDVPMQLTAAQRTVIDVKVTDNVSLIKSIPAQYFGRIEGEVSRGFLAGRDLESIAKGLRSTEQTTTRRAAFIAKDQANKLTAQMNSARQREFGITYALWKHSTVDKDPRPGHIRASREGWIFDTQVGIDFGDQFGFVLPGVAINCRCGSRSIIPGLDEALTAEQLVPVAGFPGAFKKRS